MPVHCTIDHDQELVTIVAEDEVSLDQLIAMVDELRDASAHGLRKLYDGAD